MALRCEVARDGQRGRHAEDLGHAVRRDSVRRGAIATAEHACPEGYEARNRSLTRASRRRTSRPQRIYDHRAPVNDVVIHPNQGELVSCDQAGSVKVWDLGENGCSHELVSEATWR